LQRLADKLDRTARQLRSFPALDGRGFIAAAAAFGASAGWSRARHAVARALSDPLRFLYLAQTGAKVEPSINLLLRHGVRSCIEYPKSGDLGLSA
jgi:hypothetical protein